MAGLVEFADSLGQRKHTRRKVSRSCKHTAKSNLRGALAVRAGHSQREAKRERASALLRLLLARTRWACRARSIDPMPDKVKLAQKNSGLGSGFYDLGGGKSLLEQLQIVLLSRDHKKIKTNTNSTVYLRGVMANINILA